MEHHQDCIELLAPLAPDCEDLRLELLAAQGSGPVSTDPKDVQAQHRSQAPIRRAKWRPDPDTIPVTAIDEVVAGVRVLRYAPLANPSPTTT
ncbi:MAG: hypothetical protein F2874_07040, partial [Actinobacteria bacterium]|nr:hypothetical protein [Actinomycetota bacterium]